jgi:3-oxoacid CoA-transferase subunit A
MKKVYGSAEEALDGLLNRRDADRAGGFGLCGIPELLIDALVKAA